jgi:hypothetical protein
MRIVNVVAVTAIVVAGFAGSMSAAQAMTTPTEGPLGLPLPDLFPTSSTATTHLTVTYLADTDAKPLTWHLQCDPPGGDHPRAAEACALLDTAAVKGTDPFAPSPKDQMCTFIYGGPQTATVKGTWNLKKVSASFSRNNGCEIARWDALGPLLEPQKAAAAPAR